MRRATGPNQPTTSRSAFIEGYFEERDTCVLPPRSGSVYPPLTRLPRPSHTGILGFSRWSQHLIDPVRVMMSLAFSNQLVAELYQPFWAAWQAGDF